MGKDRLPSTAPASSSDGASTAPASTQPTLQDTHGNAFVAGMIAGDAHAHGPGGHPEDPSRGGVREGLPATKAQALQRHERGRQKMSRIIDAGLAQSVDPAAGYDSRQNLYRNSAQWIDQGQADMYVVSPTHDAHLRPSVPEDQIALFDSRTDYKSAGATYDDSLNEAGEATKDEGLEIDFEDTLGTMSDDGRQLTIVDPVAQSENLLVGTLIHETQHDADQHDRGQPWAAVIPGESPNAVEEAPGWVYSGYQTEFRAYWMENPEGSSQDNFGSATDKAVTNFDVLAVEAGDDAQLGTDDDATRTVRTDFKNKRQEDIFRFMVEPLRETGDWWDPELEDWTQTYGYVGYYYAMDPEFKKMVDEYAGPRAGNLVNSVRIQALSTALSGGDADAIHTATQALDALDMGYLSDVGASKAFWDQAQSELDVITFTALHFHVVGHAPPGEAVGDVYTVIAGDNLSVIADRMLGEPSRWQEIYQLNRVAIGDDPDRIRPGQQLQLPAL